jgi:hypothetical protein
MKINRKEVTIITRCPNCGHASRVQVNESDYIAWKYDDALVQDAFPYLSAEDREKLITGCCKNCWNALLGREDEDSYDGYGDKDYDAGVDPYMGCYTEVC